jgi:hypothetical protein
LSLPRVRITDFCQLAGVLFGDSQAEQLCNKRRESVRTATGAAAVRLIDSGIANATARAACRS